MGVHSGAVVRVMLTPAPVDTGIVFVRADARGEGRRQDEHCVRAHADFVCATQLGTSLRNPAGFEIATVEHLLAACAGLGVDNLIVDVEGPELPILDGSAAPFVQLLLNAGIKPQYAPRRRIRMIEPVEVRMGVKSAALLPSEGFDGLDMDFTIRFADAAIGVQRRRARISTESFVSDFAQARTFGFLSDVSRLHALGLGRGASMENAIVLDGGKVVNPEGLRFEDEFVRHKMLDALGDISLVGAPIIGRFIADQPGHALNAHLARALLDTPEAWVWDHGEDALPAAETVLAAVG
jgi:UDP-3-O-[3-hydroxymyristoyl] N-acetylglucosamine deacetylase